MNEHVGCNRIEIRYGQIEIPISITRSRRTTVAIEVHPDRSVTIVAPEKADLQTICKIAERRRRWIRRAQREFENYLPKSREKSFVRGESFRYLGKQYRLKLIEDESKSIKLVPPYLEVRLPHLGPAATRGLVQKWYRERAGIRLPVYFQECVRQVSHIFPLSPILRIRLMPKRWGSCLRSEEIVLNPELIKVRSDFIRYVIFHELAHLKHPNHNRKFFGLLEALCPEWQKLKQNLEASEI
jgi:predicted metal-dependent hydrolase